MVRKIPIEKWEKLSDKARSRDTYFQSCGHTFYRPPYTVKFLLESRISLPESRTCSAQFCEALDQYECEKDILYMSKLRPPSVKPVNKKAALVVNEEGTIQGPYTFHEWFEYSFHLWDKFHLHLNNEVPITSSNISDLWADVYFRSTEDFVAGNYNFYAPIHLMMIHCMADTDSKHRAYADMHSGVDLWNNLEPTDISEAKTFRQNGKMFNIPVQHISNHKIRGQSLDTTNLLEERKKRKDYFTKIKSKHVKGSDILSHALEDTEDHMEVWYPLVKQIPFRLLQKGTKGCIEPATFDNNEDHTQIHWDKIVKCLTGFLTTGALKLMPEDYQPVMTATLVLANADHATKKVRPCFDGGPIKVLEAHKMPCKLEGLPQIFSQLSLKDRITKLDDTQGFHLVALHPESRDLCNFRFAGRTWQYVALPFGERKAPSAFQQANQIPLNYCRTVGLTVTCYLDDRLIAEPATLVINGEKVDPKLGRSTYLVVLLIIASGGFINMLKSNFVPTFEDEFLGMIVNTETCTVSVPERKWTKLQNDLEKFQKQQTITLHELETLRGEQCSFLISSRYLKVFIRAQTDAITRFIAKNPVKNHNFIKNELIEITDRMRREWSEWQNATILEVTKCWLPPSETKKPVFYLHTDASLAAWGAVLFQGNKQVGEISAPFPEDFSHMTIVMKEMLAIYYALVHFAKKLVQTQVIEFCDNQQACWTFHNDGSRQPLVNDLLIQIYRILFILDSDMSVAWIPTHLQIADEPSRVTDMSEEFLPRPYFEKIRRLVPFALEVDCMASIANFKCSKLIVRKHLKIPHPGIIGFDFLNLDPKLLEGLNLYIFPPKVALEKVTRLLSKKFVDFNFALLFLQFSELPLGIEQLVRLPHTHIITLSTNKALTFIPSETTQILEIPGFKRKYQFKGSPNVRPKSVRLLIHQGAK